MVVTGEGSCVQPHLYPAPLVQGMQWHLGRAYLLDLLTVVVVRSITNNFN